MIMKAERPAKNEYIRRFLAGEDEALEELVIEYRGGLTLFIYGFVHDWFEAESLMIDTFAAFAARRSGFQGKSSLKTYLFAIAKRLALQHVRQTARERVHMSSKDEAHHILDSAEMLYMQEEQTRDLYRSMQVLHPQYRQVLYLLYIEGMSREEVSRVLRKNQKQMDNLIHRAKSALRKQLDRKEPSDGALSS